MPNCPKFATLAFAAGGLLLAACASERFQEASGTRAERRVRSGLGTGAGAGTGGGGGRYGGKGQSGDSPFQRLYPEGVPSTETSGYHHTLVKSLFSPGASTYATEQNGDELRVKGDDGEFVDYANGFSSASTRSRSAAFNAGPYSTDSAAHTQRVVAYFGAAGLPSNQVGGTSVTTAFMETGTAIGGMTSRKLIGYTTVIHREIRGIGVSDSFAWAMFNSGDRPIFEQVWWPDLPASIASDVDTFKARISDPTYVSRLPTEYAGRPGTLNIHHAHPTGDHWYAYVSYDVHNGASPGAVHRFDVNGVEVKEIGWVPRPASTR